jgi:RNA 2',3'-cyclic 3'-phosphodiesterase
MPRLFTALALPGSLRLCLSLLKSGIPGARWVEPDALHLTLRFIGEVDGHGEADVMSALQMTHARRFDVLLEGVGQFGDKKPHALWAGVKPAEPLLRLAAKIDQALQRTGLPAEARRYTPHVTLARLKDSAPARVAAYLAEHNLFRAEPFTATEFVLYSSHLGRQGAHYRPEAAFPLDPS